MSCAVRSLERPPSALTDRPDETVNQLRIDEALCLLAALAARIVKDPSPTAYFLDLASQDGTLQAVWCRDGSSVFVVTAPETDPAEIMDEGFGPVNAERYLRAQKALSALLFELTRPGCDGSATLKVRGTGCELADDIRGESRRQWRF